MPPEARHVATVGRPLQAYTDAELVVLMTCVAATPRQGGGDFSLESAMRQVLNAELMAEASRRRLYARRVIDALLERVMDDIVAAIREVPS